MQPVERGARGRFVGIDRTSLPLAAVSFSRGARFRRRFFRVGRRERQRKKERAADANLTFSPNPAALAFDKAFGDRKPEACSAAMLVRGPKAIEDMADIGFRYSGA